MKTKYMGQTFPDISLLVTHYNRSRSLERLLEAFEQLHCAFGKILVSDDASSADHLDRIRQLQNRFGLELVSTGINRGLGHNINKGQDAVRTPYTLYVQEDFIPLPPFPEKLAFALGYLEQRRDTDIARFYSYRKYPDLRPVGQGFSEMIFRPFSMGYEKFYYYSDHPHLRRSDFLNKFGRYAESIPSDVTEYRMMLAFLRKKGKGIYYDDHRGLFEQVNSAEEPATVKRAAYRQSNRFLIRNIRHVYRFVKFNFNYFRP